MSEQMDEMLKDELDHVKDVNNPRLVIKNDEDADDVLRIIKALDAKDQDNKKVADHNVAAVDAWLSRKQAETQSDREYYTNLIKSYFASKRSSDPKYRLDVPNGRVSTRKNPAGLNYVDDLVLKSLTEQGADEFIRTKHEIDKKSLKKEGRFANGKFILPTGEIVDGVTEKPSTTTIKIDIN